MRTIVEAAPSFSVFIPPLDEASVYGQVADGRFRLVRGNRRHLPAATGRLSDAGHGTWIDVELETWPLSSVIVVLIFFGFMWTVVLASVVFGDVRKDTELLFLVAVLTVTALSVLGYGLSIGEQDKRFFMALLPRTLDATTARDDVPARQAS